ncbi:MAG: hypothetical protein IT535_03335 [Bauldia sp.]|nr:hypothetical protein [Bauldia sp.]
MRFAGNRYIPFHAVSYARSGAEGQVEVHLIDRDLVKVAASEFEREWARANAEIVPAPLGYEAISRVETDGKRRLVVTPIIAFRVDEAGRSAPVLLDQTEAPRIEAIRHPDGRIVTADGGRYDDVEGWTTAISRLRA